MAVGIDRVAHLAGLSAVGSTIGVLGTGLDAPYPRENLDLRAVMLERGLLLSEYAPDTHGEGRFFPVRNRIISGLAQAVLVTEAAAHSGSLNTVRHALEQGKEVFAVPGPVSHLSSRGCQELIRRGAKPVFHTDDLLRDLMPLLSAHVRHEIEKRDAARFIPTKKNASSTDDDMAGPLEPALLPWGFEHKEILPPAFSSGSGVRRPRIVLGARSGRHAPGQAVSPAVRGGKTGHRAPPAIELSEEERTVLALLRDKPMHIDDICRALEQNAGIVSGLLTTLEIRRFVRRSPGMMYSVL
jgi:DNA processing protein